MTRGAAAAAQHGGMTTESTSGAERQRLHEADSAGARWRRWGPYLSDRQWGTVREDYSADGDAWGYFGHDQARSRAYRWGEDGIAGLSDDEQLLCLAVGMWNGHDPIVKERFFGVTNAEGNHGEDVKEQYFYVDGTPTHSYMRMVYKYPQREFPYTDLVATNRSRSRGDFEYELLDTGVFAESRYFDVVVEHAKATPEDVLVRVTVHIRGPEAAELRLLPTLWFRNTWSWDPAAARPELRATPGVPGTSVVAATHARLGRRRLLCHGDHRLLFTENDTNAERLFGTPNPSPYVKDGIDRFVVHGDIAAVNPAGTGTKVAVDGRNVFQGGFLGLDNIGVFDRSAPLPTGGHLDQADGTAWMALYCQNMLQIAVELAAEDPVYLEQAQTFLEHFAWIAVAVDRPAGKAETMWDDRDGFFYDLLRLPDGSATRMRVRSMVGLLPLAAATVLSPEIVAKYPQLLQDAQEFAGRHPSMASMVSDGRFRGDRGHHLLALFDEPRLRRILAHMLDEEEFLSPYGIRSLSRFHAEHPYGLEVDGRRFEVSYLPAESNTGMFGGNSNWRGPVWFPMNALIIRALLNLHVCYGDAFTVEYPTGSGVRMTLFEVAREISERLTRIFLPDADGRRPCYGGQRVFAADEHWRDLVTFSEYFHGDNGAGLGASHQTGWTGLVALFPNLFAGLTSADLLEHGLAGVRRARPGKESR